MPGKGGCVKARPPLFLKQPNALATLVLQAVLHFGVGLVQTAGSQGRTSVRANGEALPFFPTAPPIFGKKMSTSALPTFD